MLRPAARYAGDAIPGGPLFLLDFRRVPSAALAQAASARDTLTG
jgi:hypothetical protein